jgi:lipoyl(octanoyl) transferase
MHHKHSNKLDCLYSSSYVDYELAIKKMEIKVSDIYNNKSNSTLWFLEHPPIYTAGTSAKDSDLLDSSYPVYKTGRGGKHTYHGPGQRVVYCMIDLKRTQTQPDIRQFVKKLEEVLTCTFQEVGLTTFSSDQGVGIWTDRSGKLEKIAAIGIRVKNWVTYHGIAININTNLSHYKGIVPCGIRDYEITSLDKLGYSLSLDEFDKIFIKYFCKIYKFKVTKSYENY